MRGLKLSIGLFDVGDFDLFCFYCLHQGLKKQQHPFVASELLTGV